MSWGERATSFLGDRNERHSGAQIKERLRPLSLVSWLFGLRERAIVCEASQLSRDSGPFLTLFISRKSGARACAASKVPFAAAFVLIRRLILIAEKLQGWARVTALRFRGS